MPKKEKRTKPGLILVEVEELFGILGEAGTEGWRGEDFEFGTIGAELLDEVERWGNIPFEDTGFGFALGRMKRQGTQVLGIGLGLQAHADAFRFVILAAKHAVEGREIVMCVEVLGALEGAIHDLQVHDTVEGVHLGAFRVDGAVEFGAYTEYVPPLFEHLQA